MADDAAYAVTLGAAAAVFVLGYVLFGLSFGAVLRQFRRPVGPAWIPIVRWVSAARAADASAGATATVRTVEALGLLTAAGALGALAAGIDLPRAAWVLPLLVASIAGVIGWAMWIFHAGWLGTRLRVPRGLVVLAALAPPLWGFVAASIAARDVRPVTGAIPVVVPSPPVEESVADSSPEWPQPSTPAARPLSTPLPVRKTAAVEKSTSGVFARPQSPTPAVAPSVRIAPPAAVPAAIPSRQPLEETPVTTPSQPDRPMPWSPPSSQTPAAEQPHVPPTQPVSPYTRPAEVSGADELATAGMPTLEGDDQQPPKPSEGAPDPLPGPPPASKDEAPAWQGVFDDATIAALLNAGFDGGDDEEEDLDQTRVSPRRREPWELVTRDGVTYALTSAVTIVGRIGGMPGADGAARIDIADPTRTMSKTHARLVWIDGLWMVEDLGSTNGTLLVDGNGRETVVPPHAPTPLVGRVMFGDFEMVLRRVGD